MQARTTTWRGGRQVESTETKGGDGEENEGLGLAWVGWGVASLVVGGGVRKKMTTLAKFLFFM